MAFEGIKLLLCENPLPPIDAAIDAARAEVARSNYYTEPYSAPLRRMLDQNCHVPERLVHINAGSELILRQLFQRLGQRVHLLTPTYALFPEIAEAFTETRLLRRISFSPIFPLTTRRTLQRSSRGKAFSSNRFATLCSGAATCGSRRRFPRTISGS